MVQIDIPAGFVVSMLVIDLGRRALKKGCDTTQTEKSPPLLPLPVQIPSVCRHRHRPGRDLSACGLARLGTDILEQTLRRGHAYRLDKRLSAGPFRPIYHAGDIRRPCARLSLADHR